MIVEIRPLHKHALFLRLFKGILSATEIFQQLKAIALKFQFSIEVTSEAFVSNREVGLDSFFHVEPVAIHWRINDVRGLNRSPGGRSASARRARTQPPEILVLSGAFRPTSGASLYRMQCAR